MKCEKGDLAVIIAVDDGNKNSPLHKNIGVFVDVLHRAPADEESFNGEVGWHVKSKSPTVSNVFFGYIHNAAGMVFFFPDRMLQPIRPPGTPKEVTTPEELGAFTI